MPDALLYALVARGTTVLVEHSTITGNANLVANRILEKLPQGQQHMSFAQDQHMFHIAVEQGLAFLCMADESFGRRIPFAFLEDVKRRFLVQHGEAAQSAGAYQMDAAFSATLAERMRFFSSDASADTINRLHGSLTEVKQITLESIEKLLDRGERLELLVSKTDNLQAESSVFRRQSKVLARKLWWRDARMVALLVLVLLFALFLLVTGVCGITLKQCRRRV